MTTGRINQVTFLAVQAWHPTTLLREDGGARETLTLARARSTGRPKPHTARRRKRCFSFKVGSWSQKAQAPEGERPPPHDSLILSIFHCAADALKADSLTLESNSRKRAFQRQRACCKQCQRRLQARTLRGGRAKRLTRSCELFSVFNVDPAGKHTNINVLRARTSNCVQTLLHTFELQRTRARLCFSAGRRGHSRCCTFLQFLSLFFFFSECQAVSPASQQGDCSWFRPPSSDQP